MTGFRAFWLVAFAALSACKGGEAEATAVEARFGVFFGGQIQERQEMPFEPDSTKQLQGFRIELPEPAASDMPVEWEITMPDARAGRITVLGHGVLEAGRRRFEHTVPFKPGDPLGIWNIRVVMNQRVLIDRPFRVYDRATRRRLLHDGGRR